MLRIDDVPSKLLGNVKAWLTSMRISYSECKKSKKSRGPTLKRILRNSQAFVGKVRDSRAFMCLDPGSTALPVKVFSKNSAWADRNGTCFCH